MRIESGRSFGEIGRRLWILGIRDIDHDDTGVLLRRIVFRRHVGAVTKVRGPVLRKSALAFELADEPHIAVVGALRVAARAFLRRGLALQSAFGVIRRAALSFRYRPQRSHLGRSYRKQPA